MTAPLTLSDETTREHFLDTDRAVVFRATPRETGRTVWREHDTAPDRDEVLVSEIGVVETGNDASLRSYRRLAGFSSIAAWRDALRSEDGNMPEVGYLYYVARPPAE